MRSEFSDQWTGFLGGRLYNSEADGVDDGNIWNAYVTYAMNQWLFAAEYLPTMLLVIVPD